MSIVNVAAALTDPNGPSSSIFWLFLVYCLVVIIAVLFFLFYFNRLLALILTWLINQYTVRHYKARVSIDSVRVTLLGARILFKNFRYVSTNQSISIVKGYISVRYWLTSVRKTYLQEQESTNIPCRVVCSINGLEYFIYNNLPVYNKIADMLGVERSDDTHEDEVHVAEPVQTESEPTDSPNIEFSLIQRLMPIQFECTTGALVVGNDKLQSIVVLQASQANGLWATAPSRNYLDHYKSMVEVVLRKPKISVHDNLDFLDTFEGQPSAPPKSLPKVLQWLWWPFNYLYPPDKRKRYKDIHNMLSAMRQKNEDPEKGNAAIHEEEYAKVTSVLECREAMIEYYADYPGTVPSSIMSSNPGRGIDIGNGGPNPEWGLELSLWNAVMHYGPWTDRQRAHRNQEPTARILPGQQRMATTFEFNVNFMTDATLRVPIRERSKDWKCKTDEPDLEIANDGSYTRPYGWIDIKASEGSTISTDLPFVLGANGYTTTAEVDLHNVEITTSVNYATFIQLEKFELKTLMHTPLLWNAHREWIFNLKARHPHIFLLRDHIILLQDMMHDWTSSPPVPLSYFIPITYRILLEAKDPLVYLYVNQHNIINNPNAIDSNGKYMFFQVWQIVDVDTAFLKLFSQSLRFTANIPMTEYQPLVKQVTFNAELAQLRLGLSLQNSHTHNAFLSEDDAQIGVSVSVNLNGSYDYYSTVDLDRHSESINLHFKLDGTTLKLFGTVVRYLLILRDNYVGNWLHFSTIEEYRQRVTNPEKHLDMKRKQAEAKEPVDPFEVYVTCTIQDGALILPENLYQCSHYSQLEFQELQIELRNLDIYMDMHVNVSPITWTRDRNPYPNKRGTFRIRNARDPRNYLFIDELNIYAHRLFGPLPDTTTYLCYWRFDIGRITGDLKPSFLLGTASFAQSLLYNFIDEDNAVPSEIAPAPDPDVTFVSASVREIDVCLMSKGCATNVCLKKGVILDFDNICNEKYSQRIGIKVPVIVATCLANEEHPGQGNSSDESDITFVEVAKIELGVNLTVFRQTKIWREFREKQRDFISEQDSLTRRCPQLYEDDRTEGAKSESSAQTHHEDHVGVFYAPPFRMWLTDTKYPIHSSHKREISEPVQQNSLQGDPVPADDRNALSYLNDWTDMGERDHSPNEVGWINTDEDTDDDSSQMDVRSMSSGRAVSLDNASYYTAYSEDTNTSKTGLQDFRIERRASSDSDMDSDDDSEQVEFITEEANVTSAIPPSIPYSSYLNQYSLQRENASTTRTRGFFHPFLPPPRTTRVPLKTKKTLSSRYRHESEDIQYHTYKDIDLTKINITLSGDDGDPDDGSPLETNDEDLKGNETVATTILEAIGPVNILLTPILVKVVQELAEVVNNDDWDLETMLDSLQMEYVGQLTRYLTDRIIQTRFAVLVPHIYFHFIQNVMIPDDLRPYEHSQWQVKTRYDNEETLLCSADIILSDFRLVGSVKFEDVGFEEKDKLVAESTLVLQESHIHLNIGNIGCKVQYVSEQHRSKQLIAFGIPRSRQYSQSKFSGLDDDDILLSPSELVVLDLELKSFEFKWLGSQHPNYLCLDTHDLSTIIITESAEILVGAVYSWLLFVDDLQKILEGFQDRRSRQIQAFIHELANISVDPQVGGDPPFLTTPANMLRLGSRNFRSDVGWKLLARMRLCLRSMPLTSREQLQYRLTSGGAIQDIDTTTMYEKVVELFSQWRSWEIGYEDVQNCRLFTQPYRVKSKKSLEEQKGRSLVKFLTSSVNVAHVNLFNFKFCIYEEEDEADDSSISISSIGFVLDSIYKRSLPDQDAAQDKEGVMRDGYLDVTAKFSIGIMAITVNPTILAFAHHMLMVQRVFTSKLSKLSHATRRSSWFGDGHHYQTVEGKVPPTDSLDMNALLAQLDVVAQALLHIDMIDMGAHAQKLMMRNTVSNIDASVLLSNPKLTPLALFQSSDKSDSDTGSGRPSTSKAARKYNASRIIFEGSMFMEKIDIMFFEELHRHHVSPTTLLNIGVDGVKMNANISKPLRKKKTDAHRQVLTIFSGVDKFSVHVPQSLRKLYGFVAEWKAEQGKRYHFMFQNLLQEWEEQRRVTAMLYIPSYHVPSPANQPSFDFHLQFLLREFVAQVDLLKCLEMEYSVHNLFIFLRKTKAANLSQPLYKYGFQLTRQEVAITKYMRKQTKDLSAIVDYANTFNIPSIRSTGSVTTRTMPSEGGETPHLDIQSFISVAFISMSLNVSMIDSILTAQNLLGNELSDLMDMLSHTRERQQASPLDADQGPSPAENAMSYCFNISLDGLRISAESPTAIGLFESNALKASIAKDCTLSDALKWKLQGKGFSVSLNPNMAMENKSDRRNRLAYIVIDFAVENEATEDTHSDEHVDMLKSFSIDISKFHTVMQPNALGILADIYVYYDTELKRKEEEKKSELERLASNTRRLMQSFSNDLPSSHEDIQALWKDKVISIHVKDLGVAIPLNTDTIPRTVPTQKPVNALLFSVASIEFSTKNMEESAAILSNVSLQFIKRFDQGNEDHFTEKSHPSINRMHFPRISFLVFFYSELSRKLAKVDARVGEFEIDVDGTFADYINSLNVIYVSSMDRVTEFTSKASQRSRMNDDQTTDQSSQGNQDNVQLQVEGVIGYDKGVLRIYPKRYGNDAVLRREIDPSLSFHTKKSLDRTGIHHHMATVHLPAFHVDFHYQTILGVNTSTTDVPKRFHCDFVIHKSENNLHPCIIEFLHEISRGLKLGIQQSSDRKASRSFYEDQGLDISILVQLSATKVTLNCMPSSMVICSLGWDDSEFLVSTMTKPPATRMISCAGSLRNVSVVIKHSYSTEGSLKAELDTLTLNAMLASQREDNDCRDDAFITVHVPSLKGDINLRDIDNLYIFKSFWFNQAIYYHPRTRHGRAFSASSGSPFYIPAQVSAPSTSEKLAAVHRKDEPNSPLTTDQPTPFATHFVLHMNQASASVEFGSPIGTVVLAPNNFYLALHNEPNRTQNITVSMDGIQATFEKRLVGLVGDAQIDRTLFRYDMNTLDTGPNSFVQAPHKSTTYLSIAGIRTAIDYEYQDFLYLKQGPIELDATVSDTESNGEAFGALMLSLSVDPLFVKLPITTVPKVMVMIREFRDVLRKKLEMNIAHIRSPYDMPTSPKGTPSTPVTEQVSDQVHSITRRLAQSQVEVHLKLVDLIVYRRQAKEQDNINVRASDVSVSLDETRKGIVSRTLTIAVARATMVKGIQAPAMEVWSQVLEHDAAKKLGGALILGFPATRLTMSSEQINQLIKHTFATKFESGVNVTTNLGLVWYPQEMFNTFQYLLDEALGRRKAEAPELPSGETEATQEAAPPPTMESKASQPLVYEALEAVDFKPQLQIMADATPSVAWIGVKPESLPAIIHENVTQQLDTLLDFIWSIHCAAAQAKQEKRPNPPS